MLYESYEPCPICGRMVSAKQMTCPDCGKRRDSGCEPEEADAEAYRDVDFRALLNLLGMLWIGWGLFRGCFGFYTMAEGYSLSVAMSGPSLILMISLESLTWFVSGLAALHREMWGVYLGYVYAYLTLLANLFSLNPTGICVAVGFILLSRRALKHYQQLKTSVITSDHE